MTESPEPVRPYSALAAGYDVVMQHVDYALWAEYVLELIDAHAPHARSVIELGCGTGSLALEVQERAHEITGEERGFRYLATDGAGEMIRVAEAKARMAGTAIGDLRFEQREFFDSVEGETFDVVLLLYDGLNYLLEEEEVEVLLRRMAALANPRGIVIVDQSTPANSLNNEEYFADEGKVGDFAFVRRSQYDRERRLHITEFDLTVEGENFVEHHIQRAYTYGEMLALISRSPLTVEAAYDGFSADPAGDEAERIHWVLRRED